METTLAKGVTLTKPDDFGKLLQDEPPPALTWPASALKFFAPLLARPIL